MYYKTINENKLNINEIYFPGSIMIKLTRNCNLDCIFCSQNGARNEQLDVTVVIKILVEASEYGVNEIIYSGGEPLMYPYIKEIIKYGEERGLNQTIVSNGIGIKELGKELLEQLKCIGISIHGDQYMHDKIVKRNGAYQKVIESLKFLEGLENRPYITLNFTIFGQNVSCYNSVVEVAKRYDCDLYIARINSIGRAKAYNRIDFDINEFLKKFAKENIKSSNVIPRCQVKKEYKQFCHSCSAGIASVCVNANGDVGICGSSETAYGNVYKTSLFDIWNNENFRAFRMLNWLPIYCKHCKELSECMGGCKAELEEKRQGETRDYLVHCALIKFINSVKEKKVYFKFDMIRKIGEEYLILGNPLRIIDSEAYIFCEKLKKAKKVDVVLKEYINDKENVEGLLFSFYRDGLLEFY